MEPPCSSACVTVVANSAPAMGVGELPSQGRPIHVQGLSSPQSCVLASVFMCVCVCACKQGAASCEMMAKNNILH